MTQLTRSELETMVNMLMKDNADKDREIESLKAKVKENKKQISEVQSQVNLLNEQLKPLLLQAQEEQKQRPTSKEKVFDVKDCQGRSFCPYSGPIPFQLAEGNEILIKGTFADCDSFGVSLCSGRSPDSNITLHFSPIFDQQVAVLNHRKGEWGTEVRHGDLPFHSGHAYEMKIIVGQSAYQIFVNDSHFCDFKHRLPKEIVRYLIIDGDTHLHGVEFINYNVSTKLSPPVPFTAPIPRGVQPGSAIFIEGVPTPNAPDFNVQLVCGPEHTHDDLGLALAVRFQLDGDINVVVRSSRAEGCKLKDERQQSHFPFALNKPFTLQILADQQAFKVAVNNDHFIEYQHQIYPINRITHLHIFGSVRLTSVRM